MRFFRIIELHEGIVPKGLEKYHIYAIANLREKE